MRTAIEEDLSQPGTVTVMLTMTAGEVVQMRLVGAYSSKVATTVERATMSHVDNELMKALLRDFYIVCDQARIRINQQEAA